MKDDKQDNECGQSIVELALTLPLLLFMFLGTVELGQVCYGAINVSNAAKAAAQYGAQDTNTAVQTGSMLTAAQREIGTGVPGQTSPLDMPAATTMPDGSALPTGTVCTASGGSYTCSYCSCSSPDSGQAPFACGSATALTQCTGISHLEQNIVIQTRIFVKPIVALPGLPSPYSLLGHAVVKRLQ
jgi:hypothetical protein